MSRLEKIKTTKPAQKPARILIYGIEGVGKTTFGAGAPNPIFIAPEGGTDEITGAVEMPAIHSFDDVRDSVKELISGKHDYKTLVIDSADWLEKLCHAKIIGTSGRSIVTCNGGYGTGYRESEKLHRELIEDLSLLREKRNMNVITIAHYTVREVKDPEAIHDYDAFEIKCHEQVSSLWREWVDAVFFARFKTYIKPAGDTDEKTVAVGSGERVMYTEKRPAFQAKNRYNLPFELKVSWDAFQKAREASKLPEEAAILSEISEIWGALNVSQETSEAIHSSIEKAKKDPRALMVIRDRLLTLGRK